MIAAKSASFIQAFSRIGLIPDAGGTYTLPRLVGTARAMAAAMLAGKSGDFREGVAAFKERRPAKFTGR